MESLSETQWDVLIEGTGLQQSLLALALSRSDKKVLHVDENDYYGGAEAAFSLQDIEDWVARANASPSGTIASAHLHITDDDKRLGASRAYTLALSPQIIYTKSKLVGQLVSSKVYRQLEFQAVGNWWIYSSGPSASLKRLPNGREDIFQDDSIDNRAKRSLMKFLKFVVSYESQADVWEPHASTSFNVFLSSQFQLPPHLQTVISALTLSLDSSEETLVSFALPRIARHLTSIGVFGPGFGAVIPKWGGLAEIAQVACRACAVGGGVYVLGTGIKASTTIPGGLDQVELSNGDTVKTRNLASAKAGEVSSFVSKAVAIVSSSLASLFVSTVDGSPTSAVAVIVIPVGSMSSQVHPIYIMAHSSETGECPQGQCVLYATTRKCDSSTSLLTQAITAFLAAEGSHGKVLYTLHYEAASSDLAFDDTMLSDVEETWKRLTRSDEPSEFMHFEERNGIMDEDYEEEIY